MSFSENVSFKGYADSANKEFDRSEKWLYDMEKRFETRMNGKTTGSLIGAIFGTVCWLVAFCVFFWWIKDGINNIVLIICFGVSLALVVSLFIDEIIGFSYYRRISSYIYGITMLKNRVIVGRNSIESNRTEFMSSRTNGWQYPLSVGDSITEEAVSIENTISGIESLKAGFINTAKNILFFTLAAAVSIIGSVALFETAGGIMTGISGKNLSENTIATLCIIGLLVSVVGEIILAKIVWSCTDCSVTNITLLIVAAGPALFLALVSIVALLVMLVVWVVQIIISLVVIVIAGACVCGAFSGG